MGADRIHVVYQLQPSRSTRRCAFLLDTSQPVGVVYSNSDTESPWTKSRGFRISTQTRTESNQGAGVNSPVALQVPATTPGCRPEAAQTVPDFDVAWTQ